MKKEIGIVGLGKMGGNIARRLLKRGWRVVGMNQDEVMTKKLELRGVEGAYSLSELVEHLKPPRVVWLMIPAGKAVDETLFGKGGLATLLSLGDIIIDGGNSFFANSQKRHVRLAKKGIHFLDAGVSGGPNGALKGASLMIGGEEKIFNKHAELFSDLAVKDGYGYMGSAGAGHFVKMVHNGIEYGMMQSIAEGFAILKASPLVKDLENVTQVYNNGSVIESRLVGWLEDAYTKFGKNLSGVSGSVAHTGEGEWTVQAAKKLKVPVPVIQAAFDFRVLSKEKPSYAGRVLSALRNQFGGHDIKKQ